MLKHRRRRYGTHIVVLFALFVLVTAACGRWSPCYSTKLGQWVIRLRLFQWTARASPTRPLLKGELRWIITGPINRNGMKENEWINFGLNQWKKKDTQLLTPSFLVLLVKYPCLKVMKTWPQVLPFCFQHQYQWHHKQGQQMICQQPTTFLLYLTSQPFFRSTSPANHMKPADGNIWIASMF